MAFKISLQLIQINPEGLPCSTARTCLCIPRLALKALKPNVTSNYSDHGVLDFPRGCHQNCCSGLKVIKTIPKTMAHDPELVYQGGWLVVGNNIHESEDLHTQESIPSQKQLTVNAHVMPANDWR